MSTQMNKQELASRIWELANDMRDSIEASDYKDYILGFIFYKYLSDKQYEFLFKQGLSEEEIYELTEDDQEIVEYVQKNLGYFIVPKDLYQNWLRIGNGFTVDNVIVGLKAFQRNISSNRNHQKVYSGIFNTLETGISKLGSNTTQQTQQVRSLVELIQDIPTVNDDYDVLGYIYEYLIGKFAAGAGKKSGEFFTPVRPALYMALTLAEHLKDRETIEVYDPTSGSGSLLLNIAKAYESHQDSEDNVKFYTQELKPATEILTRMNLVMRGIKPSNIVSRQGNSLKEDFPYFDESDPEGTYTPVFVDAVVSNPPYSQKWDPSGMDHDPRFASYGLAPKSKADYAFLLHGLYHLKPDGIMAIVLPHGVLFRNEEKEIRQKLIEKNNIEAVVGLPANIFFGTGISTTIMFLKKNRTDTNILFIDASKGFEKVDSKNDLRQSDVKRLADVTNQRIEVENYSKLVSKEEVIENDYNLNITRYVDASEEAESWDVFATINGGIPKSELSQFDDIFEVLPELYDELFNDLNDEYTELRTNNIHELFQNSQSVERFKYKYEKAFEGFSEYLDGLLIEQVNIVHPLRSKNEATEKLFYRYEDIPLIDKYHAYGLLDEAWIEIANDIEVIQRDSLEVATRAIDPNMVLKKKKEVQDGTKGRIFAFELIQEELLPEETKTLRNLENRQVEIQGELSELVELLSEEDGQYEVLNQANDKFAIKNTKAALSEEFEDIKIPELNTLAEFAALTRKNERLEFMDAHSEIKWQEMDLKMDGTPKKAGLNSYAEKIQANYDFPEESFGYVLSNAVHLIDEESQVKKNIKGLSEEIITLTEETIENLTEEEIKELLHKKWITPLVESIHGLVDKFFKDFESKIIHLNDKYKTTMNEVQDEIQKTNSKLTELLSQLTGNDVDMTGLSSFQELIGGELNE